MTLAWAAAILPGLVATLAAAAASYYIDAGGAVGYRKIVVSVGLAVIPGVAFTCWAAVDLADRRKLGTPVYWWGATGICVALVSMAVVMMVAVGSLRVWLWATASYAAMTGVGLITIGQLYRRRPAGA